MTLLEQQIQRAQRRLWFNRWLGCAVASVGLVAALYGLAVLVDRLFLLSLPLGPMAIGAAGLALLVSIIWAYATREDSGFAAAALDRAAGLKERISSGQHCLGSDDPFAGAVVADAESVGRSLTVSRHIRLSMPRSWAMSSASVAFAALMFLVTPGLLVSDEVEAREQDLTEVRETKARVNEELAKVRRQLESNKALEDLKDEIGELDLNSGMELRRPGDVRHEAIKKIDKLADAVKQRSKSSKYDEAKDVRRMMRRLKIPKSDDAPTQKLAEALSKGDYETAREEMKKLKEQLATLKSEQDQQMVKKIGKQLEDLAKQIKELPDLEDLEQKLAQAGIKKEDAQRMLEQLSKKDLDQLKKQLEEKGMSQQQIDKLAKQMQRKQGSSSQTKQLANSMAQAAAACQNGQPSEAGQGLAQASGQLSDLEALEQEMDQLQSTMNSLEQARGQCQGNGQVGPKDGPGNSGMGTDPNRGRGGLATSEQTGISFKTERGKVPTGKGAIIGQLEYEGEQVEGELSTAAAQVRPANEREASDLIPRDRIPRQYHKAIKRYFSMSPNRLDEGSPNRPGEGAKPPSEPTGEAPVERAKPGTESSGD